MTIQRTELAEYLGKQVVCVGKTTEDTRKVKGITYICVKQVSVYLYNKNTRLKLTDPTMTLDHLWVIADDIDSLTEAVFGGEIVSYTRKDGTEDFAVKQLECLYLPAARNTIHSLSVANKSMVSPSQVKGLLDQLDYHKDGILIDFGNNTPRSGYFMIREALLHQLHRVESIHNGVATIKSVSGVKGKANYPSAYARAIEILLSR